MNTFSDTPIEYLKGVGPKRAELLKSELGIRTFSDLYTYYPFRYIDRRKVFRISELSDTNTLVQIRGKITNIHLAGKPRSQRLVARFEDDSGSVDLVWFRGLKWIKSKIKTGNSYLVFGRPSSFNNVLNIAHPEIEDLCSRADRSEKYLFPFYSSTEKLKSRGLDSKGILKLTQTLLAHENFRVAENLSAVLLEHLKLIGKEKAIRCIHFPENQNQLKYAQTRLKFEEFFFIQLKLVQQKFIRKKKIRGNEFKVVGDLLHSFYENNIPFQLTEAQKRVIKEIRKDLGSGIQMNRLLQGDVGSGKTLVALMTILIAIDNGFQACLMAPTEILARQHLATISQFLKGLKVSVYLLTGSTKASERKILHNQLKDGNIHLLIGTHALLEDAVVFKNLGLVIIDEQHRFGVAQRARLWKKSTIPPHILVMTATPIPRTLAMSLYGDLDISVINELPPGRKPIKTMHYYDSGRLKVFGFIRKQIQLGRQIYIVYPLIEESEKLDLKDLMDGFESISREFPLPQYAVSMVHGKMKQDIKDFEMDRFARGETQILVSTTVIEVGVDIPNASVMLIENAERFGLSQLHQLRGRVGRGVEQSYCILMTGNKVSKEARSRISTMVRTNDGFEIAEADLKIRGPGDIKGTRQSGLIDLKIADIVKDEKILHLARKMAFSVIEGDPDLNKMENAPIARYIEKQRKVRIDWSRVS
jgi:ATP-dependent DNA helicase RecG